MKIVHWTMYNASGMNQVAVTMNAAEKKLGLDSHIANPFEMKHEILLDKFLDADVHIAHTYFPEWFKKKITKSYRLVWIAHGTPEYVFGESVAEGEKGGYGINDGVMLQHYYLQHADAIVTHWPRHQAIYQQMVDKHTKVNLVPMGVDKDFWKPVPSQGKYVGEPSLFSAENCHTIKWPYDLFVTWSLAHPQLKTCGSLHVIKLPTNIHRWFFPLVNRNGASYACHISASMFDATNLRNAFVSTDFFIGLVTKGDFNRLSHEANSCGAKSISYPGNPFSDFWVREGDQRDTAHDLIEILEGRVEPRKKLPVPSCDETALQMKAIYESC